MKKTEFMVVCGQTGKYGFPVYRRVFTDGNRYFVKWHKKTVDVTDDIIKRHYIID